jgi:peptidoglycan/LPS O-acetylase OafA/YrhL
MESASSPSYSDVVMWIGLLKSRLWPVRSRLWPESGAMSPIPALDGLRALAILLVLVFHAWYNIPGYISAGRQASNYPIYYGRTGVHLFFVLSGFLLFLPYARWIFGLQRRPLARLFYKRRALRVGPAYWASLIILTLAAPLSLAALGDFLLHVVFLSNVWPASIFSINGVFWTMAIEVQFYLVLPAIAWFIYLLSRRMNPIAAATVMALALALVVVASQELYRTGLGKLAFLSGALVGESALSYWLVVFGLGILCSVLYIYFTSVAPPLKDTARRLENIGAVSFVGGCALALLLAFSPSDRGSVVQTGFGVAYAMLLFGILFGWQIFRRIFAYRAVRFVGLISYSFYIWHSIVLRMIEPLVAGLPFISHVIARFLLGGALSVVVAYVSYQLVERPFIAARRSAHETVVPIREQATTASAVRGRASGATSRSL